MRRDGFFVRDFGKNVLKHLPKGALLLSDRADELEFTMAYLLYACGYRQDIKFIDCNAGVSRSIYGDDYYRIWGKARLKIRERVERKLIQKISAPVYYGTNDTSQIDIPQVSKGFLYHVPGTGEGKEELTDILDNLFIQERWFSDADSREKHLYQNTRSLLAKYYLDNSLVAPAENIIRRLRSYCGDKKWGSIGAYWFYERKMYKKAEEYYRGLIDEYPEDQEIYVNLGALLNELRKYNSAEDLILKALKIKPNYAQGHYNLAVTYWHKKQWKKSADEFGEFLRYEPNNKQAQKFYNLALGKSKR